MKGSSYALTLLLVLFASTVTHAQDMPPPPPPPPPSDGPPPPPPSGPDDSVPPPVAGAARQAPKHPAGWARPAAYLGFAAAAAALGMGLSAEIAVHTADLTGATSMYLEIAGGLLLAAGGPIVFVGGSSARFDASVTGSRLMRVIGWIGYAAGLVAALAGLTIYASAQSVGVLDGVGITTGIFASVSLVAFGLDALWSAQDADDLASIMTQAPPPPSLRFSPVVSVTRGVNGLSPVLGLQGMF
jgi:hypothetical protein